MSVRATADTLRRIPIFRDCDSVPLQLLAFAAQRQIHPAGLAIINEGANAEAAHFIVQGTANLKQADRVIGRAEPGALLGETAMLSGSTYSLSAIAQGEVETACIDRALFDRVAREYPEFARSIRNFVSAKLEATVRDFEIVRQQLNKAKGFPGV